MNLPYIFPNLGGKCPICTVNFKLFFRILICQCVKNGAFDFRPYPINRSTRQVSSSPEPMVELTGDRETSTAIMPIAAKMYPDPIINSKNGYHES